MKQRSPKRRYPDGTVLRNTVKAIRKHPNHFSPEDRYRVTGHWTAEWFKAVNWTDPMSGIEFVAGEVIDQIRCVHDSYVEPA